MKSSLRQLVHSLALDCDRNGLTVSEAKSAKLIPNDTERHQSTKLMIVSPSSHNEQRPCLASDPQVGHDKAGHVQRPVLSAQRVFAEPLKFVTGGRAVSTAVRLSEAAFTGLYCSE